MPEDPLDTDDSAIQQAYESWQYQQLYQQDSWADYLPQSVNPSTGENYEQLDRDDVSASR